MCGVLYLSWGDETCVVGSVYFAGSGKGKGCVSALGVPSLGVVGSCYFAGVEKK